MINYNKMELNIQKSIKFNEIFSFKLHFRPYSKPR